MSTWTIQRTRLRYKWFTDKTTRPSDAPQLSDPTGQLILRSAQEAYLPAGRFRVDQISALLNELLTQPDRLEESRKQLAEQAGPALYSELQGLQAWMLRTGRGDDLYDVVPVNNNDSPKVAVPKQSRHEESWNEPAPHVDYTPAPPKHDANSFPPPSYEERQMVDDRGVNMPYPSSSFRP
ncbi:hypothetical protein [Actinophytocola algeriensis]|uniref:Uncharacterized protein n=1 Tax=Actinophytocola algeriensis TaxID=1768010 RepID=A0A7W7Q6A7_9PSEU|nr:hypothetical protein [Actinophytocola algeriensis]MBB4907717.1 hypothetical protein [Actinophytocola algeriensis]MBE1479747.1 hypothetical protein [Actinophytocola algeriensis]